MSVDLSDLLFGVSTGGSNIRILSYASEGVPITRSNVQTYQSQLLAVRQQASSQVVKPLIGLLSSVDNPLSLPLHEGGAPVNRNFGLSDEGVGIAGIDRREIEKITSKLTYDVEPVHRAWATAQQQTAELGNFYNYGLNPHLLKEYIAAQVGLRIDKSRRVKITKPTDVAGTRSDAFMRQQPVYTQPAYTQPVNDDPWRV